MEFDKTLNLPKTDFPMRGNLPKKELEIINWWKNINIYNLIQNKNIKNNKFILHDGPPYANGDIHLGTTLNKILKDIVIKYKSMNGFNSPFIPGWDTHGLPISQKINNELKIKSSDIGIVKFREKCKDYALKFVDIQKKSFERLGIRADFKNSYLTLNSNYESNQIKIFGDLVEKKYIYKGLKPVYWCSNCETALAEAEVNYEDVKSISIYVKFKVLDDKKIINKKNIYFIIWTTTPWTLLSNVAISINPKFKYLLIKACNKEYYILAKELFDKYSEILNLKKELIVNEFNGSELEFIICENPIKKNNSIVILGEHVTSDVGTGCVHTAPGHGIEDFEIGQKYNLPVFSPVNNKGVFTEQAGKEYEGKKVLDINSKIIENLILSNNLLKKEVIIHSYPHCWRCKGKLIFRATHQWFASIDCFRKKVLKIIKNDVSWIPKWGQERIYNMVSDRSDWCISRQREWGVPIPIFYCKKCKKPVLNKKVIYYVAELIKEKGSNIWFSNKVESLLLPEYCCINCKSKLFEKETDIMDVWFDSGVSYDAVLKNNKDLNYPADLYLEGSDQYRGWFNSSLLLSVATEGKAPYKKILSHGYVVDGKGLKMSKSLGNGINPKDVIKQLGADILRLWASSEDYKKDISVSNEHLKQITEYYRKIRNTLRFLHGNLFDFNNKKDSLDYENLQELDKIILFKLNELIKNVTFHYENYEFYMAFSLLHNFCAIDMSSLYLDVVKDRLYASYHSESIRRSVQTVIFKILMVLIKLLTPILSFTMEEMWFYFKENNKIKSPQLLDWPEYNICYKNDKLMNKWKKLFNIRNIILKALELGRKNMLYGNSLNAKIILKTNDKTFYKFLNNEKKNILDLAIVSRIDILNIIGKNNDFKDKSVNNFWIQTIPIEEKKCERCWMYIEKIGKNKKYPTLCNRCIEVIEKIKKGK